MRPITVGIVEDVPEMQELLSVMFEELPGVRLAWVRGSVKEARLEMSRNRVDLVFLDEVLPGELSHALIPELRSVGTEVILITGQTEPVSAPLPVGVLTRLPKPSWEGLLRDRPLYVRAIRSHDWSPSKG